VDDARGSFVVVHATTAHPASDARIAVRECGSLVKAGYDVRLVAQGPVSQHPRAHDIPVVLLPRRSGRARRALNGTADVLRAVRRFRPDLVHVHDPELIPLVLLLRAFGTATVYDAHEDLAAQVVSKPWIPRTMRPTVALASRALVKVVGAAASSVVAATPHIAESFPARKTVVVRNYPSLVDGDGSASPEPFRREKVAVYVGAVTEDRGSVVLARAAELLPEGAIVMAGPIADEHSRRLAREPGWSRINYLGQLDHADVLALERSAVVGLVTLKATPAYVDSLPTKLFEYMAAGLSIVASDFGTWSEVVRESGCGILVDPVDPQAVASAIARLLADPLEALAMGESGRRAAVARFSWESEGATLVGLYDSLLPAARRSSVGLPGS